MIAMHKPTELVIVEQYNPEWTVWFERLSSFLESHIGRCILRIEHVGSTAIPGMVAKPIIDTNIVIHMSEFEETKSKLESIGYKHLGDLGISGREAFDLIDIKLRQQLPPHHLYVCDSCSEELHRHIAFRDYLREHPDVANEYSKLKMHLVKLYDGNRELYIKGKDSLVRDILEKALQWFEDRCNHKP